MKILLLLLFAVTAYAPAPNVEIDQISALKYLKTTHQHTLWEDGSPAEDLSDMFLEGEEEEEEEELAGDEQAENEEDDIEEDEKGDINEDEDMATDRMKHKRKHKKIKHKRVKHKRIKGLNKKGEICLRQCKRCAANHPRVHNLLRIHGCLFKKRGQKRFRFFRVGQSVYYKQGKTCVKGTCYPHKWRKQKCGVKGRSDEEEEADMEDLSDVFLEAEEEVAVIGPDQDVDTKMEYEEGAIDEDEEGAIDGDEDMLMDRMKRKGLSRRGAICFIACKRCQKHHPRVHKLLKLHGCIFKKRGQKKYKHVDVGQSITYRDKKGKCIKGTCHDHGWRMGGCSKPKDCSKKAVDVKYKGDCLKFWTDVQGLAKDAPLSKGCCLLGEFVNCVEVTIGCPHITGPMMVVPPAKAMIAADCGAFTYKPGCSKG